jgi:hypothetical protein
MPTCPHCQQSNRLSLATATAMVASASLAQGAVGTSPSDSAHDQHTALVEHDPAQLARHGSYGGHAAWVGPASPAPPVQSTFLVAETRELTLTHPRSVREARPPGLHFWIGERF